MLAVNPALTPVDVKDIIRRSCTRIDEAEGEYDKTGHSIWYGYGRIDAGKAVENARTGTAPAAGPSLFHGSALFSNKKSVELINTGMVQAKPVKKLLGLQIYLQKELSKDHWLRYKLNVPGEGILSNAKDGEYAGTTDGRRRVIGIAIELVGPKASHYSVEYAVRFKGIAEPVKAADGAWAGSAKKSGKTVEGIAIAILKKSSV
jgi:hypothetical protein